MSRLARFIVIALGTLVLLAGVAAAATITQPSTNPFTVPSDGAGNPVPFTVAATGYVKGQQVFVEQCDGVASSTPGWSPLVHCDLGSSPAPVIAAADGSATFLSTDANHALHPFKGESPQSLFNCLSPHDPAMNPVNGLTDYRNCQVRVSSNNTTVTSDQAFFTITLPDAVTGTTTTTTATTTSSSSTTTRPSTTTSTASTTTTTNPTLPPGGQCQGAILVGTYTPSLAHALQNEVLSAKLTHDKANGNTANGGTCNTPDGTFHPKAFSVKLAGASNCLTTPTAGSYPLNGKVTITMTETHVDPKTLKTVPWKIQAYVTELGINKSAADVVDMAGIVYKGSMVGQRVSGSLWFDSATKNAKTDPPTSSGYHLDAAKQAACVAGGGTVDTVLIGDGSSPLGGTATGLKFSF